MRRLLLVAPGEPLDAHAHADRLMIEALVRQGFVGEVLATLPPGAPDAEFFRALDHAIQRVGPEILLARADDPRASEILRRGKASGLTTALRVRDCANVALDASRQADVLLTTTKFAADYLHEFTGVPVAVLPDLIDLDKVQAVPRDARYLTFFDPTTRGGLLPFARIAAELGARRPEIPLLVIAGPEAANALNHCGLNLGALGTIDLMAPPADPRIAWERTRVALIPSLDWAAGPDLALAALLNGVPTIASDRGSLPEALGDAGILLPLPDRLTPATPILPTPEEVAPWVDAILQLWDDPEFANEHHQRAQDQSAARDPQATEARLATVFRDLGPARKPLPCPPRRSTAVVLVPNLNGIEPECEDGLRELERQGLRVDRRRGCSQIDVARNEMASAALHDGAQALLFIDADIGFDPADALRLLARPEPVLSGLYAKKKNRELASTFPPGLGRITLGPTAPGAYPLQYAATGFLRIQTDVLHQMIRDLDLPLCNQNWGRGVWPFFQPLVVPHPEGFHYLGEDWAFSHRLAQIGITPLADASFRLWHHGSYGYTWEDAGNPATRYRDYQFHPSPIA